MKKIVLSVLMVFAVISSHAGEKNYKRMTDSEMKRCPEAWMLDFSKQPKWNYCHGLVMQSVLQTWDKTGDDKYYNYVYEFADMMVGQDGSIKGYKPFDYNIDRVNTGNILFPLLAKTGEERFRKAVELQRGQMKTHPRTSAGSFWHKKVYPHQVWLDGLYMACPFLAKSAVLLDEPEIYDDLALQIIDCHKFLFVEETGLYKHGYDESRKQKWADKETGLSPNYWSRSIGWYMMAIVDVLDYMPENHPQRAEVIDILRNLSASLIKYQDAKTGMWYQVTDKGGQDGNYLESTGSIMYIYSWIKGAQKGYLDKSYLKRGKKAYGQFVKQFVKEEKDGTLSITSCCAVAGLGGEKFYRDGTYEYYISEPVRDNDPKSVGPFIMTSILLDK